MCIVADARTRTVAQTYGDDRDANALLIAAAPDLVAALREIAAFDDALASIHLDESYGEDFGLFDEPEAVRIARAALEKIGVKS